MRIRLETAEGEFVYSGDIPYMRRMPGVIFWGLRFFALHDRSRSTYRETQCWTIPVKEAVRK